MLTEGVTFGILTIALREVTKYGGIAQLVE